MKKISVITVVFNGETTLEPTILSVLNQTFASIEYLIIDGKSKDQTLKIIEKYAPQIDYWISEPDKGLYDAMNKGLKKATGEFVLFLNAGDTFSDERVLERVFEQADPETDVLYGEVMMVDEARRPLGTRSQLTTRQLPQRLTWQSMAQGMVVSHQAFLPRLSICPPYIEGNLCADIDWVIKILKKSRKTVFTNVIIADFLIGGVSKQRHQRSLKDRYSVLRQHFGLLPNLLNHAWILWRAVWFKLTRRKDDRYM